MYNILVVEDEQNIRKIIKDYLEISGMYVVEAEDGEKAIDCLNKDNFHLVLLDVMLPKMSGWEVCQYIKNNKNIPVLFLTARGSETDELNGFQLGADDYIVKPFKPSVLVARIERILQNYSQENDDLYYGGIEVNINSRKCKINEQEIHLTKLEFDILVYLMRNQGKVIDRTEIIEKLWGYEYIGDYRIVDTQIKKLRKQLGSHAFLVRTIYGVGYIFEKE